MLKLGNFEELKNLREGLLEAEKVFSGSRVAEGCERATQRRPKRQTGGSYPDLKQYLPKSQMISGAYSATPYVREKQESSGEYLGPRWSPPPRNIPRVKPRYGQQ